MVCRNLSWVPTCVGMTVGVGNDGDNHIYERPVFEEIPDLESPLRRFGGVASAAVGFASAGSETHPLIRRHIANADPPTSGAHNETFLM